MPERMDVDVGAGAGATVVAFPALRDQQLGDSQQTRKVLIPTNRLTPLRGSWLKIYTPLVEQMKLQVRFNPRTRTVEMRNSALTTERSALQRAADFVRAFSLGFEVEVRGWVRGAADALHRTPSSSSASRTSTLTHSRSRR